MNEKLSFQYFVEALSRKGHVQRKVSEAFIKAFFDTVSEAVREGADTVKIDGFGTFKCVDVGSRESVNVSNGERIVIPGYRKLTFVPDESVTQRLGRSVAGDESMNEVRKKENQHERMEEKNVEKPEGKNVEKPEVKNVEKPEVKNVEKLEGKNVEKPEGKNIVKPEERNVERTEEKRSCGEMSQTGYENVSSCSAEQAFVDGLIEVEEPSCVEMSKDEFSGIDMIISTPESVADVRLQLEEATARVAEAIEQAKKASAEKTRLERLLERLEKNVEPERLADKTASKGVTSMGTEEPSGESGALARVLSDVRTCESSRQSSGDDAVEESSRQSSGDRSNGKRRSRWVFVAACVAIVAALASGIVYLVYGTFLSIESVETVPCVKPDSEAHNAQLKKETREAKAQKKAAADDAEHADAALVESAPHSGDIQVESDKGASEEVKADESAPANVELPANVGKAKDGNKKVETPARPKTYVLKKGESLTRISQRFYGTKDSVRAIIRVNTFANPNNVPAGAVIKLP